MPRPRFQRASPEKREALLDAATREFGAHGYDAASMNRILLSAGFSKGAFYYYFDDKADLAAAVVEREAAAYFDDWPELFAPATAHAFWAELGRLLELGKERMIASPGSDALSRLGVAAARRPELLERLTGPLLARMTRRIAAVWKRGQDVGAVRTDLPLPVLMQLLQGVKMAATTVFLPEGRPPTAAEIDAFVHVHFDLVRRIAEPGPRREASPPRRRAPRKEPHR